MLIVITTLCFDLFFSLFIICVAMRVAGLVHIVTNHEHLKKKNKFITKTKPKIEWNEGTPLTMLPLNNTPRHQLTKQEWSTKRPEKNQ